MHFCAVFIQAAGNTPLGFISLVCVVSGGWSYGNLPFAGELG